MKWNVIAAVILKVLDVVHDALFLFFKNYKEEDKEEDKEEKSDKK